MRKLFYILVAVAVVLSSCRREFKTPSWETSLNAPLIYSDLGIEDLIPDSLISVNADNSINLVFDEVLFKYGIDSLLGLADSTIKDSLISFTNYTAAPGATLYTNTDNNTIAANGAELTQINLSQGFIDYTVKSTVQDTTIVTYTITTGTMSGMPISLTVTILPGSPSSPRYVNGTFNLAGAQMDLTGPLHNTFNSHQTQFIAKLAPGVTGVNIVSLDSRVAFTAHFRDMKPSYIRGYFGNFTSNEPLQSQAIDFLHNMQDATLDLSQVNSTLYVSNGIGADARIRVDTVMAYKTSTGASVLLNHPFIGQDINFNRATDMLYYADPYLYNVDINSSNSNIESFIELLPDVLKYKVSVELNPLGDVSAHSDFLYGNSKVEMGLKVNIPLNLMASQLRLADTVDFNLDDFDRNGKLIRGKVRFNVVNGLPLQATLQVQMLDENNMVIGNLLPSTIVNGNTGSTSSAMGTDVYQTFYAELEDDNMLTAYRAKKLRIFAEFATAPSGTFVSIYNTQRFKTQISVLADYLTSE